ncbi:hypothetical protein [Streptomyces sp. NPDC101166]|uniref:hypothetical protein n=1 Tax=Streptomyces sp. NPDC101166 TaxID=3366120 RepID=UPI00380E716B
MTTDEPIALLPVGLTGPIAGRVADFESIMADFSFARECALRYTTMCGGADQVLPRAVWNAAVISFRRGFTSGRGLLVEKGSRPNYADHLTALLTDAQKQTHDEVCVMANQHVAHRVANHEQASAVVYLVPPPHGRAIAGVGSMSVNFIGPPVEVAEQMVNVCETYLRALSEQLELAKAAFRHEVENTIGVDSLYLHAARSAQ